MIDISQLESYSYEKFEIKYDSKQVYVISDSGKLFYHRVLPNEYIMSIARLFAASPELLEEVIRLRKEKLEFITSSEWKSMETAPKDETEILICTENGNQYVVSYDKDFSAPWRVINDFGLNENVPKFWMNVPKLP